MKEKQAFAKAARAIFLKVKKSSAIVMRLNF